MAVFVGAYAALEHVAGLAAWNTTHQTGPITVSDFDDPAHFRRTLTLRDGSTLLMRAVRPDDLDKVVAAFHALDPESVYTRFHSPKKELTAGDIERFNAIDFVHAIMLVLVRAVDGEETIVGGASCFFGEGEDGAAMAEVSFTIEEDFQRNGLAGTLLQVLIGMARQRATTRLEAEVLAENTAMLKVFERCGLPMTKAREGAVMHVELAL